MNAGAGKTNDSLPWYSHYQEGVPHNIDYEPLAIPDFLERSARSFPDHTALVYEGTKITYQEFNSLVNRLGSNLTELGVEPGDSVAIAMPNLIPAAIGFYAALRIGAIAVMNNPQYTDRELEHQLNDSGAKVVITLDLLANRMIDLRLKTSVKHVIVATIGDYLPQSRRLLFKLVAKRRNLVARVSPAPNVHYLKDLLKKAAGTAPRREIDLEQTAIYQYTGGTTGVSKGAMLSHANLSRQIQQVAAWFPNFHEGEDSVLGALPVFHVFGLAAMNLAVYRSWQLILVPRPQPKELLSAIRRFRPSFTPLVPTMINGILNHPDIAETDLSCIKACFSGSAPLPKELTVEFERRTGSVIVEGFGLTETSPVTHCNPFSGGPRKTGSVGLPLPDTFCRVVSTEDGMTEVAVGQPGELVVKGPQVMKGYLNMPEETAQVLKDGWLHTGDVGKMDEDGYFYIVDRIKDVIISGGFNIYPRDIDEVLYKHPKVLEVCTVGIPHPHRGEAVKCFVVLKEGQTATAEEMIEYCATGLAKYKLPTEIEFRDSLPKTAVGKILRKELRKANVTQPKAKDLDPVHEPKKT